MALYYIDENVSLPASADLSAKMNLFVTMDFAGGTAGQISVCDGVAAAEPKVPLGVLLDKPNAQGVHGNVQTRGIAKVKAGAATTKGGKLMVDTGAKAGKVVDYADPGASKSVFVVGQGLNAAGAEDEIVEVLLNIVRSDNASA